jgi:tetratricopeptide (TPR) repeat protein
LDWKTWRIPLLGMAALVFAFEIYSPALDGPFVLDDLYLPFQYADAATMPVRVWLAGQRPVLMLSFWLNYQVSGAAPGSYHSLNVLLHVLNAILVWGIARRLSRNQVASLVVAGVFLAHPLMTEAVAYVASRSDVLSTTFCYGAYLLFLRGREAGVSWGQAARILLLFVLGVLTKEHSAALPAVFLLTDFVLGGIASIRSNLRLHGPVVALGALGGAYVAWRLSESDTAGFAMAGLGPLDYFFTQTGVIWHYLRLVVLPLGLNVDPDFAIARAPGLGMVALLALVAAAIVLARRAPLVSLGIAVFLVLLAPTSSFVPIRDVAAERRMYLPFVGLALVLVGAIERIKPAPSVLAWGGGALVLLLGVATHARATVWSSEILLWEDTVAQSPNKWRPRFQLADAYFQARRYDAANREFERAAAIDAKDPRLFVNWGISLEAMGDPDRALEKFQQAAKIENTAHTQSLIGMVHGKQGRAEQALAALAEGERLDPNFGGTYVNRGNVYSTSGDWAQACPQYQRALRLDPHSEGARQGLRLCAQNGVR